MKTCYCNLLLKIEVFSPIERLGELMFILAISYRQREALIKRNKSLKILIKNELM